jgi:hypothetical protein
MTAILILILLEAIPLWAYLLATFITSSLAAVGVGLLTLWLNRGKPAADIHESRARAARDFAEADEIRIRASFSLEDESVHRTQQMMRAQRHIFELQAKNRNLEDEVKRLRANERKQIGGAG